MKKISFAGICALAMLISCGGGKTSEATINPNVTDSEEPADGIERMMLYDFTDTLRTDGKTFIYTIHREASDSLPLIIDDEGNRFADNVYTLTIRSGGTTVFQRRFTKATFSSYLSKEFQKKGILDGMMCDKSLPGLRFAVSVSLPQSDMFEPLLMKVDTNGGIVITRDERGEAELEDDGDGV